MNTELLLIRHGETEWNIKGKFQGCHDINLSNQGIRQAQFLKEKLNYKFDFIYTSPLIRAIKTAKIICKDNNNNLKPIVENDLREINFGKWEGLTIDEIKNNYPIQYQSWATDKITAPLVGGDLSLRKASIRARDAIIKIAKLHKGKRIVIVSHGGILKAGLIGIFNWDMSMYHKIRLGNTSISKIVFNDDFKPLIMLLNDTSHLPQNCAVRSYI
ncbi:histidine phosphatase family protein [Clostridium sp. JN-1]|uniref:histidine phosphatase family protein n=1 Tax=Clostridium sp. JN-1 TaxID=2483110 RepID=UPI000F0B438B|nr:histidine phosphatase family protein [Clostridium sp. JN-1]